MTTHTWLCLHLALCWYIGFPYTVCIQMYIHYTCSTLEQANGKMGIPTELRNCTGSGNGDDCY